MKVVFTQSKLWQKQQDLQAKIEELATETLQEVKRYFPELHDELTFVVQASGWESIPETGTGGFTRNSRLVLLFIDPGMPFGVEKSLQTLKAAIYHELNHAARYEHEIWHKSLLDNCIMEGLATVFEREMTGEVPLWGRYEKNEILDWVKEIDGFKENYNWHEYMYKHSDGRRWIGYKAGTFLIDEAIKHSGRTVQELTKKACSEIINLSKVMS